MVRPQVALAQSPMVAIRGQTPNRIIVGQVVKQIPAGEDLTNAFLFYSCLIYIVLYKYWIDTLLGCYRDIP